METRNDEIYHHGILGQKKGIRRYQNPDGSLTPEGRKRYLKGDGSLTIRGKMALKKVELEKKKLSNKYKNSDEIIKFNNAAYKQLTGKSLNRRGGGKNTRELLSEKDIKDMSDSELQKYYTRLTNERNTLQTKQQTRKLKESEAKEIKYDKLPKGQKFIKKMIDQHVIPSVREGVKGGITEGLKNTVSGLITKMGNKEIDKFVNKQYENKDNTVKNRKDKSNTKRGLKEDLQKDASGVVNEFHNDVKTLIPVAKKYVNNYDLSVHISYAKKTNGRSFTEDFLKNRGNVSEAEIIEEKINDISKQISKRQEIANKERKKLGYNK